MGRMKKKTRKGVMKKLKKIIKGYVKCSSILSEYLAITSNYESTINEESNVVNIIETIDENIESIEYEEGVLDEESNSEHSSEDSSEESIEGNSSNIVSENLACESSIKLSVANNVEQTNDNLGPVCDLKEIVQCEEESAVVQSINEINSEGYCDEDKSMIKKEELNTIKDEDCNTDFTSYPSWLLEYSRKGKVQSCVMDIISLRQHFFIPQVEDFSLPSVHFVSVKILSAVVGLLLGTSEPYVTYWTRNGSYLYQYSIEPIIEAAGLKFPLSLNLMEIDESIRKSVLLDIAETALDLKGIPDEWHLYIIAVIFWLKNMNQPAPTECHLHTIVMCIICIYTIDSRIGVHRNKQSFTRKYKKYLNKILEVRNRTKETVKESNQRFENETSPKKEFENITHEDCVVIFETILPYHHLSEQIKTKPKTFCLNIVHAFSQFQSCLYYIIVLNSVLGFPFKEPVVSHLFSGTFAYNMFTNLSKRNSINDYIDVLFQSCASLLKLYKVLVNCLQSALAGTNLCRNVVKKHRKKKKESKQLKTECAIDSSAGDGEELFIDVNNRFSGLLLSD